MLMSHDEIVGLCKAGVVEGWKPEAVNAASLDIHLGGTVMICSDSDHIVDYRKRERLSMLTCTLDDLQGYVLRPDEFILAQSQEVFNLPNDVSAEYKLKSSMARIGLEHMNAGWCFTGDTSVSMLDGTEKPIRDVEEGDFVYSLSPAGDVAAGKVTRSGVSKHVTETVKVTLDNGTYFECTPEHKVMRRDGSFIEAQLLAPGNALMPLYRKVDTTGHEKVYCPHLGTKSNWANLHGRYKPTHRLVAGVTAAEQVVHHVDGNPRNNVPHNLHVLTAAEHNKIHCLERNQSPELRRTNAERMSERNKKLWQDAEFAARKKASSSVAMAAMNARQWKDPAHRAAMRPAQAAAGAKVMATLDKSVLQRKAKLGAVRKAVARVLSAGLGVTEETYTAFKRQNAPTTATLVREFGSFAGAIAEASGYENHKVVSVEHVTHAVAVPVYDVSLEGNHNFALACGVFVHNCDAGWNGSVLTLEFKNYSPQPIRLRPGDPIGQMVFFKHAPVADHQSYAARGRYNGDKSVSSIKE